MGYLVLAILCSALVSLIMRASEGKTKSDGGMFLANYLVCILLAALYLPGSFAVFQREGLGSALGLGGFTGVLFLASFLLLRWNIRKNGVVLSAVFMKLGVVVPILMAMIFFREMPSLWNTAGILTAIAAIVVIHLEKEEEGREKLRFLLLLLLFGSGITDSMMNVYDKTGSSDFSDYFLLFIFCSAFLCSVVLYLAKKERLCRYDLIFGALVGVPNYYSSRFLLLSLNEVPAVIAYPVYSVAAILLITLAGALIFREGISGRKAVGLLLVILALALLNI